MNMLERWFKGLADVTRLRILNLLSQGKLCGCDIQYVLGTTQSNISRHLTYLKNCGLLQDRRSGYRVYYHLAVSVSLEHRLLFDYLGHALKREEPFVTDLRNLKAAIKNGACTVSEWSARHPETNSARFRIAHK